MSMPNHDAFPLEDNLVIARQGDKRLFVLNATARFMWELFERGLDVEAISRRIVESYDVSPETARADLEAALAEWRAAGLLEAAAHPLDEGKIGQASSFSSIHGSVRGRPTAWLSVSTYSLWGMTFTLRAADATLADLLGPLMAHLRTETEDIPHATIDVWQDSGSYLIACNDATTANEISEGDALTAVLEAIVRQTAPELKPVAVLHASAVSDGQGAAVLAAPAGHGKSTLTAALAHAGLIYFSDDSVPLVSAPCHGKRSEATSSAPFIQAVAMPLAICLKGGSWPVLASRYPELDALPVYRRFGQEVRYLVPGAFDSRDARGAPVRCLLFPHYEPGREATLAPLSPTNALQRLIEAQAWLSFEPDKLGLLINWLVHTPAYALEYGSLEQAVPLARSALSL